MKHPILYFISIALFISGCMQVREVLAEFESKAPIPAEKETLGFLVEPPMSDEDKASTLHTVESNTLAMEKEEETLNVSSSAVEADQNFDAIFDNSFPDEELPEPESQSDYIWEELPIVGENLIVETLPEVIPHWSASEVETLENDFPIRNNRPSPAKHSDLIDPDGMTIATRIAPPSGFTRQKAATSFGEYLRHLPLKKDGAKVHYYDGSIKANDVHVAVVDMDVGKRDLQQCADAIMRLRAEHLYKNKQYDDIHFNFTNGFNAKYAKWRVGNRIKVKGNKVSWYPKGKKTDSYSSFRKYMNMVFAYAGTRSLEKELKPIPLSSLQIGDVFIRGGSPGHAVIIVDVAVNSNGKKIFLLAQSYMPAQEIQILKNKRNHDLSPWYTVDMTTLYTPEWTFETNELKRF